MKLKKMIEPLLLTAGALLAIAGAWTQYIDKGKQEKENGILQKENKKFQDENTKLLNDINTLQNDILVGADFPLLDGEITELSGMFFIEIVLVNNKDKVIRSINVDVFDENDNRYKWVDSFGANKTDAERDAEMKDYIAGFKTGVANTNKFKGDLEPSMDAELINQKLDTKRPHYGFNILVSWRGGKQYLCWIESTQKNGKFVLDISFKYDGQRYTHKEFIEKFK